MSKRTKFIRDCAVMLGASQLAGGIAGTATLRILGGPEAPMSAYAAIVGGSLLGTALVLAGVFIGAILFVRNHAPA